MGRNAGLDRPERTGQGPVYRLRRYRTLAAPVPTNAPATSSEQPRQRPMLSSRFGRDTAAPLGGVDLGGTHPPLVLERGAQLAVLGFEFPEPLGRVVALARHGRQHPRVAAPMPEPPSAAARCRSPAAVRGPAGAAPRAPTVRSRVSSSSLSIVTSSPPHIQDEHPPRGWARRYRGSVAVEDRVQHQPHLRFHWLSTWPGKLSPLASSR